MSQIHHKLSDFYTSQFLKKLELAQMDPKHDLEIGIREIFTYGHFLNGVPTYLNTHGEIQKKLIGQLC